MKSITFTTGEFKEEKISAWLTGFIKFAQTLGALELLDQAYYIEIRCKTGRGGIDGKGMTWPAPWLFSGNEPGNVNRQVETVCLMSGK